MVDLIEGKFTDFNVGLETRVLLLNIAKYQRWCWMGGSKVSGHGLHLHDEHCNQHAKRMERLKFVSLRKQITFHFSLLASDASKRTHYQGPGQVLVVPLEQPLLNCLFVCSLAFCQEYLLYSRDFILRVHRPPGLR